MKKEDISVKDISTVTDQSPWKERKHKKKHLLSAIIRRINNQIQRVNPDEEIKKFNPNHDAKGRFARGSSRSTPMAAEGVSAIKKPTRVVGKSKSGLAGSDEAHRQIEKLFTSGTKDVKAISDSLKKGGHKSASGRAISVATIKAVIKRIDQHIDDNKTTTNTTQTKQYNKDQIAKIVGLFHSMGHDDKKIGEKLKEKGIKTESGRNVSISTVRSVIKRIQQEQIRLDTEKKIADAQKKVIEKPVEQPKKEQASGAATSLPKGMTMGKRSVQYNYPKPFATMKEAKTWIETNLADRFTLTGSPSKNAGEMALTLSNVNAALSHVRFLAENRVSLPKISELEFIKGDSAGTFIDEKGNKQNAAGFFHTDLNKIQIAIPDASAMLYKNVENRSGWNVYNIQKSIDNIKSAIKNKDANQPPNTPLETKSRAELVSIGKAAVEQLNEVVKGRKDKERSGLVGDTIRSVDRNIGAVQAPSPYSYDYFTAGTLLHELGHAWHFQKSKDTEQSLGAPFAYTDRAITTKVDPSFVTSSYSGTNHLENMAEAFSLYMNGQVQALHPKFVDFFDKQFPTLNFGKVLKSTNVSKSDILDLLKKGLKK